VNELSGGQRDELGVRGPVLHPAEHLVPDRNAFRVVRARVDAVSDGHHRAGQVAGRDVGRAVQRGQRAGVDARRLDPDHDLTDAWFGIGGVVDPQVVDAAEPVITHHSHSPTNSPTSCSTPCAPEPGVYDQAQQRATSNDKAKRRLPRYEHRQPPTHPCHRQARPPGPIEIDWCPTCTPGYGDRSRTGSINPGCGRTGRRHDVDVVHRYRSYRSPTPADRLVRQGRPVLRPADAGPNPEER